MDYFKIVRELAVNHWFFFGFLFWIGQNLSLHIDVFYYIHLFCNDHKHGGKRVVLLE